MAADSNKPAPAAGMLSVEQAQKQILSFARILDTQRIPLRAASGRIAAEDIVSPIDLPRFDNSAMDGYAVRSADVLGVSEANPKPLRQVGYVPAGCDVTVELQPGQCARLFTGSALPAGADAVVMQEDTRREPGDSGIVQMLCTAVPGDNVRRAGADIRTGDVVAQAGRRINPARLALLAATGCAEVPVHRRPIVGLAATGNELIEPGRELAPGQIYESNRTMLAALSTEAGAEVKVFPLVPDDLEATVAAMRDAVEQCDVLITTGGVSVGEMDYVKPAFQRLGGELRLWRVAMKPGKPIVFGTREAKLLFGLPGNPVSSFVCFLLFARPLLLAMQGARELNLPVRRGRLAEPLVNEAGRRHFCRVILDPQGDVRSAGLQGSHNLASLSEANGLVDIPPGTRLSPGTPVDVISWE